MFDSLIGISPENWVRLGRENGYRFSPQKIGELAYISIMSLYNKRLMKSEVSQFNDSIENTQITQDPVFLLGHWRSGTTFLHNLISLDPNFAYPTLFDVRNPSTFLTKGAIYKEQIESMSDDKRSMDNMRVGLFSPSEEEFATAILTLKSPLIGWMFPKRAEIYDRYLTFEDVNQEEIDVWKKGLLYFLKKLTFHYDKQLLLKSPTNTGRIPLLLEMFPNAKFINIHRHPFEVFRSTKKLYNTAIKNSHLQNPVKNDTDQHIIDGYRKIYTQYFKTKDMIPPENLIEVRFEDLESNCVDLIRHIYDKLNLRNFEVMKPKLRQYHEDNRSYKKNTHAPLSESIKSNLLKNWDLTFDAWEYNRSIN